MNVAPWNFHEREVFSLNDKFFVKNRIDNRFKSDAVVELIFVHFSGFDYAKMSSGIITQKNIPNLIDYDDIHTLTDHYSNALKFNQETFNKYISLQYSYNYFDNGKRIIGFHRRIYRSLIEAGEAFVNPFETTFDSLYTIFVNSKMINENLKNFDKITKSNLPRFDLRLKKVQRFTVLIYKIIGLEKYLLMIKLFKMLSRIESHQHLLDRK
jgi:hypothetical protein